MGVGMVVVVGWRGGDGGGGGVAGGGGGCWGAQSFFGRKHGFAGFVGGGGWGVVWWCGGWIGWMGRALSMYVCLKSW